MFTFVVPAVPLFPNKRRTTCHYSRSSRLRLLLWLWPLMRCCGSASQSVCKKTLLWLGSKKLQAARWSTWSPPHTREPPRWRTLPGCLRSLLRVLSNCSSFRFFVFPGFAGCSKHHVDPRRGQSEKVSESGKTAQPNWCQIRCCPCTNLWCTLL